PVGLMQLDRERHAVYHNARLLQILQAPIALAAGDEDPTARDGQDHPAPTARSLLRTLTREGVASFQAALGHVLEDGVDEDVEVDIVLSGGEWRRALMNIRALHRPTGEISGAITSVLDVTDSARAHEELQRRATFDALTGCYNRGSILDMLERELERED